MGKRSDLREEFEKLLGSKNVYFQPPESFKLNYPCIVYNISRGDSIKANNMTYRFTRCYEVTYISKNPDDGMIENIIYHFPMIEYDRHFVVDKLNHEVFTLYY